MTLVLGFMAFLIFSRSRISTRSVSMPLEGRTSSNRLAVHTNVSSEQMTWSPAFSWVSSARLTAAMPQETTQASSAFSREAAFSSMAEVVGLVVRL